MTDDPPVPEPAKEAAPRPPRRGWRRFRVSRRVGLGGLAIAALLVVVLSFGVRVWVRTEQGRAAMAELIDGRSLGRLGKLQVEGLSGDLFDEFTIGRLAVVDAKGPWLEGRQVTIAWRPMELLLRRVHAERMSARLVTVIRRPELAPDDGKKGGGSPVSVRLDQMAFRLETLPAFSQRRGLWDLTGAGRYGRNGVSSGQLKAVSQMHAGDGATANFRFGPKGRMFLRVLADEGEGGAFGGSLGLDATRRVTVRIAVDGDEAGGSLTAIAQSGAVQPVSARGRWFKGGASLDAHLLLTASTLADGYVDRLGPTVDVTLRSSKLSGDLYQINASGVAQGGRASFAGPVDWKKRTTPGATVEASLADLSKWVEGLKAGPAHGKGQLKGGETTWSFAGAVDAARIDQFGYRLDRLAGPAELSAARGELRVKADLSGAGGAGQGIVPGMLGASPRANVDATRLKDGRILVRSLAVQGAGAQLTAQGDRGLLGSLTMKGTGTVSNLALIRPGATGKFSGGFTASQSGAAPWAVGFDVTGDGFASGMAELDRLLGPQPALKGDLTFKDDAWVFKTVALNGRALQADATGRLDADQTLALDVDWKAAGPFGFGPVQVVGDVSGKGRASGPMSQPRLDLDAELASVDFGQLVVMPAKLALNLDSKGPVGHVALTGASNYGPARAEANFRVLDQGLALDGIDADAGGVQASGAVTLTDGAPSTADLKLAAGAGAFLSGGKLEASLQIVDRAGGPQAKLALAGSDLAAPGVTGVLKTVKLNADGPWAKLPFTVSADSLDPVLWRFAGQGVLAQATDRHELSLTGGGRIRRAELRLTEPALVRFAPDGRTVHAAASLAGGTATLDARQVGPDASVKLLVKAIDMAPFAQEYMGRLDADLDLQGRGGTLTGSLDAEVKNGRSRDAPENVALDARLKAVLAPGRMTIDAGASNPQGLTSSLNLVMPAEASARPFRIALARTRPMTGRFAAHGEIRPLWDLLAGGARNLSGEVTMDGTIAGTLAEPRATGQVVMAKGRFQDPGTGLVLQDIAVDTRFDGGAIQLDSASASDGKGGTVSGSGRMDIAPGGASSITLDLKRFQLIQNEIARATASGRVIMARASDGKAKLSGQLAVDRADVNPRTPLPTGVVAMDVVEINRPIREVDLDQPRKVVGPDIALDVQVAAARGIFVRGNGLNIELSLDARVGGTVSAPALSGTARVVRGDYDFAGKRFEFDNRGTIRLASRADQVRLNLTATREDPTLTAVVVIEGTAAKPVITLTSNPVLPQDEVLAQVLFGRSASQLTPLETAQLASAVASLATGGGFDVLGGLRQFARLDRLALAGGGAEGATVSGGKYLTDDVYVELTGGGREGPSAQIEWRVRRNFSLVSTLRSASTAANGQSDAKLSVRFRKNY